MADRQDLTINEGRDVTITITVDAEEGAVIDNVKFQMARHAGSHTPEITKELDDGIDSTTEDFVYDIEILPNDTWGLEGIYYYEVVVDTQEGRRITVTYGYITIADSLIGEVSE